MIDVKKWIAPLLFTVLTAAGQNILQNPSFEIQGERDSGMPEAWSVLKRGTFDNTHKLDSTEAFDGKRSAKIENQNPACDKATVIWMQSNLGAALKKFAPGMEMELSVFIRAVGAPCITRLYFESPQAKKTFLRQGQATPEKWRKISISFKVEDINYGSPYVCLQLLGNGSVLFDGAYLGPAGKNPWGIRQADGSLIANGGAEYPVAGSGWSILKRSTNGEASTDRATVAKGACAFKLECPEKPSGMFAWNYTFEPGAFDGIAPDTPMVLTLDANTHGNPATTFRFYIEFTCNGKFIGTYMTQPQSIYVGWKNQELRFKMPKEIPTSGNLYVQLLSAGTLSFDNVDLRTASGVPETPAELAANDFCRFSAPPPNFTWILPSLPSKLPLELFIPDPKLEITLSEIDGKVLKTWKIENLPVRKTTKLEIELPKLNTGAYELKYSSGSLCDYDWFRIREPSANGATFDTSGMLVLDGKTFFPIGIVTPSNELDSLRVYSRSGINTVVAQVSGDERGAAYTFDVLGKFGLKCVEWNNWGFRQKIPDAELRDSLIKTASYLRKYKGFIGFLSDEAPWNGIPLGSMRRHYKFMFKYMQDYIAWMNHAPRITGAASEPRQSFDSARRYSRASDVTGLDIYPVPEGKGHNNLPNETISCVGNYTDLCRELTWNSKPVWMALQAFGWSEEGGGELSSSRPRPTEKQLRFMVWNAITHGARGIFWYGNGAKDVYSDWWCQFAKVNMELAAIGKRMELGPVSDIAGLPPHVRGISGKGFQVYVNEDNEKSISFNSITIEPQGVAIITDEPLNIPLPPKFTPEKVTLSTDHGIRRECVLIEGEWTAHPEYLRGDEKKVFAKHTFVLDKKPINALLRVSVDDSADITVNGQKLEKATGHRNVSQYKIADKLEKGENTIIFEVLNVTGPTGLVFDLQSENMKTASGIATLYSMNGKDSWKKAHCFGKPPVAPWGAPNTSIDK